ncbi:MAG: DMT family transporter [Deltaproteobacteria bacterium]|nr:DMT family transporter [Deltaproteobacteria bacterium]
MNQAIYAILAAVLFGAATPFTKVLLSETQPIFLAGLLYLSSGLGLMLVYFAWDRTRNSESPLAHSDVFWLAGAVLCGGILAPALLMVGLSKLTASSASLLLNLETVFTAVLAWIAFREHFSIRTILGMSLVVAGGVILSWPEAGFELPLGSVAVVGASLCWGIDNNLTQKVSAGNPVFIAAIKGIVAGCVNLGIGISLGAVFPSCSVLAGSIAVGCLGYGVSLVLFVLSLRHIGTARTGAYFSVAPFVGAAISVTVLHEPFGATLLVAVILMGTGIGLHLTEKHVHEHVHGLITHGHSHSHGSHHVHEHEFLVYEVFQHTHRHVHEPMSHDHDHYPDIHHRHDH